jgi:hypothetical protein
VAEDRVPAEREVQGMQRARRDGFLVAAGLELDELTPAAVEALDYLAEQSGSHYDGFMAALLIARGRRGDLDPPAPARTPSGVGLDYSGMGRTKARKTARPEPGNAGP